MNNVMLDLETLGTRPGSIVLSIGAVFFDPTTGDLGNSYYDEIDVMSCVSVGLHSSVETIEFWKKQTGVARAAYDRAMRSGSSTAASLKQVLEGLTSYLTACGPSDGLKHVKIWGNGAAFDNAILAAAYHACGLTPPWQFYNDRCFRTLKALGKDLGVNEPEFEGTKHHALHDAMHQARWACQIFAALGSTGARETKYPAALEVKIGDKPALRHAPVIIDPTLVGGAQPAVERPKKDWPSCPVCHSPLAPTSSGLVCENGHGC